MLLQTVRPNIVQAIRAYRVEDLMQAAEGVGQHFLYANLTAAQSKQEVLEGIAEALSDDTAEGIGQAAGHVRHDHADRPRREGGRVGVLRQCRGWQQRGREGRCKRGTAGGVGTDHDRFILGEERR